MCHYSVWPLLKVKIFFVVFCCFFPFVCFSNNNLANRVLFIEAAVLQQCSGKSIKCGAEKWAHSVLLLHSLHMPSDIFPQGWDMLPAVLLHGFDVFRHSVIRSFFWRRCRQINSHRSVSLHSAWRELYKSSNWASNSLSQDVALFLNKKVQIESHSKTSVEWRSTQHWWWYCVELNSYIMYLNEHKRVRCCSGETN